MSNFEYIINWYQDQCDGQWEHYYGVSITTIDNPGWRPKISIAETYLENHIFESLEIERSDSDWIHCCVEEGIFKIACGAGNLDEALGIFREWSEKCLRESTNSESN